MQYNEIVQLAIAVLILHAIFLLLLTFAGWCMHRPPKDPHPDWKGRIEERFRWSKFRFEFGRWCYNTNCFGDETKSWWEWEKK